MQEKSESSESSEQTKKFNLKELRVQILSMSKQDAMDYILGDEWYRTPRPFQFAIQVRAGANLPGILEMYIRSSIANLGQIKRAFNQSEKKIAELLGVKASAVHMAAHDLKAFGIVRKGKNGERKREWAIEEPKNEPDPEKDARPSDPVRILCGDPVKELCVTQSKYCDPPSQETVADPVKKLWPHNTRKDLKKKEKKKKEDKKEASIPSFPSPSFFKKEDKAREHLKEFDLHNHRHFSKAYFGLLKMVKRGNLTETEMDLKIASECLNKVPQDYRCQAILTEWMIWYVLTSPRPNESPYLSNFKKSWDDFLPTAQTLLEAIEAPERQRREAELKAQREQDARNYEERMALQATQEKQRQEEAMAREEARKQKAIEEEEARKKRAAEETEAKRRKADEFLKSLPSPEAIRLAINAVPVRPDWLDNHFGYHLFMGAMFRSVPVLRFADFQDPMMYHYPYIARDAFGKDHRAFEQKSRDFVLAEVEQLIAELKAKGEPSCPNLEISWKRFARFFGIPEEARFERPRTMVAIGAEGEDEHPFGKDEEDY